MTKFPLVKESNIDFKVAIQGRDAVGFSLSTIRGILYATLFLEDEPIAYSVRCIKNSWLFPKDAEELIGGNFRFETFGDEYPSYENFGDTCYLVFYNSQEMETMNV